MIKVNQQKKKKKTTRPLESRKTYKLEDVVQLPLRYLCDPQYFWHLATVFLLGEFVLCTVIIKKIACKITRKD